MPSHRKCCPNEPCTASSELVAKYGYDVKYASHALRLAYQGLEVARAAQLTLPMPARERERVLAVKRGDVPDLAEVLGEIADTTAITAWSASAHRRFWGWA